MRFAQDLEDLFENAPCGYVLISPSGTIFKANRTILSWLGYDRAALTGKKFHVVLNLSSKLFYETHFLPRLRMEGRFDEVALDFLSASGKVVPVFVNAVEQRDSQGRTLSVRMTISNSTDRRRFEQELLDARRTANQANAALQASNVELSRKNVEGARLTALLQQNETRLRMAQEAGHVGSFEVDIATNQITVTEQFCRIFGLPSQSTFSMDAIENMVFPGDEALASSRGQREAGELDLYSEYRIRRADTKNIIWIARRAQISRDAEGMPSQLFGTVQDISERKAVDDRQNLLNEELSHRLKNTLALVQAIASQTLKSASDRSAVHAFNQRVTALSHAHDVLLRQSWSAADMRDVVAGVLALHADANRLVLEGPVINLGPKAALSLSLLLHELATNAVKYGALSASDGRVMVVWSIVDADLKLMWSEQGGPPASEPKSSGLGTRLINLGFGGTGKVSKAYLQSGLVIEFFAPLKLIQEN